MKDIVIEEYNKDKGFIRHNNFKIIELDSEHSKLEYRIKRDGLNPVGMVHGGLLFGLCDTAAGVLASMSGKFPLTISSNINYLKPARGKKIFAIAKKLKEGKTIGYYSVDLFDENNSLVTSATINMFFSEIK
ncbi:MAG: PaaI family thioesterase [Bacilli bacterium]|nr:PaaI family thioesterase [Bacilli bacterium]